MTEKAARRGLNYLPRGQEGRHRRAVELATRKAPNDKGFHTVERGEANNPVVPADVEDERVRAYEDYTAMFGDPPRGRSALERRGRSS